MTYFCLKRYHSNTLTHTIVLAFFRSTSGQTDSIHTTIEPKHSGCAVRFGGCRWSTVSIFCADWIIWHNQRAEKKKQVIIFSPPLRMCVCVCKLYVIRSITVSCSFPFTLALVWINFDLLALTFFDDKMCFLLGFIEVFEHNSPFFIRIRQSKQRLFSACAVCFNSHHTWPGLNRRFVRATTLSVDAKYPKS